MFKHLYLLVVVTLFGFSIRPARSQSCTDGTTQVLTCMSGKCVGQYSAQPPNGGTINDNQGMGLLCCGKLVHVFTGGGPCQLNSMRSPEAKAVLAMLFSNGVHVMIEDCGRHLQLYTRPVLQSSPQMDGINLSSLSYKKEG